MEQTNSDPGILSSLGDRLMAILVGRASGGHM